MYNDEKIEVNVFIYFVFSTCVGCDGAGGGPGRDRALPRELCQTGHGSGQDTGRDTSGKGEDRTGKTGQDRTGQDRTGQERGQATAGGMLAGIEPSLESSVKQDTAQDRTRCRTRFQVKGKKGRGKQGRTEQERGQATASGDASRDRTLTKELCQIGHGSGQDAGRDTSGKRGRKAGQNRAR
jgi:hypothetical protein